MTLNLSGELFCEAHSTATCGSDSHRVESAQYLLSKGRKGIINLLAEKVGLAHFFFWDNDGV
jgi:hypothetical protein